MPEGQHCCWEEATDHGGNCRFLLFDKQLCRKDTIRMPASLRLPSFSTHAWILTMFPGITHFWRWLMSVVTQRVAQKKWHTSHSTTTKAQLSSGYGVKSGQHSPRLGLRSSWRHFPLCSLGINHWTSTLAYAFCKTANLNNADR
jgi:hypothetical protein